MLVKGSSFYRENTGNSVDALNDVVQKQISEDLSNNHEVKLYVSSDR